MISSFGVQLFTIRDTMDTEEHIRESFKKLKAMGYDEVQTAGCAIPYDVFGKIAKEEGLTICGTHDSFDRMVENPQEAMKLHRMLDTTYMGIGGMWYEKTGWEPVDEFIDKANRVIEAISPEGFTFTYHNHSHEFARTGGAGDPEIMMDRLIRKLDPRANFVLDTYWVQHGGGDVRYWLEKLAGRVDILHLKDMGRDADGPFITEIGNGNLWWEGILKTALDTGVKHFVVEQDTCPGDPFDSLQQSINYLHQLS